MRKHVGWALAIVLASLPPGAAKATREQHRPNLRNTNFDLLKRKLAESGITLLSWQVMTRGNGRQNHRLFYFKNERLYTELHLNPQRTNNFGKREHRVTLERLRVSDELRTALLRAVQDGEISVNDCCVRTGRGTPEDVAALLGLDWGP